MKNRNDLLPEFIAEAKTYIEVMEAGLLRMLEMEDTENSNQIFRAAHSIKGLAGFFDLEKVVELTKNLEAILGKIREKCLHASPEIINMLLFVVNVLRELITNPHKSKEYDISCYVSDIQRLLLMADRQPSHCPGEVSATVLWELLVSQEQHGTNKSKPLITTINDDQPTWIKGNTCVTAEKNCTILLAEDTPFFLMAYKSFLESDGFTVITTVNGQEAWETLLRVKVDVVVSDIEMPVMTGIELVRAIRANESLRHLPVIALTSLEGESNKKQGLLAGFDFYEFKLDRAQLLDRIKHVLAKKRT